MRNAFALLALLAAFPTHASDASVFQAIDIYLETDEPVAAWQFRLSERHSSMTIVGVENGESEVFSSAPYYDRAAVRDGSADRIIVADYSLADPDNLPKGRIRIATLHVMLSDPGKPDFDLQLVTATTADGSVIDAAIDLQSSTGSEQ